MIARSRKLLTKAIPAIVVVVLAVAFSAWHARRLADTAIHEEIAPPPYHSTHFVLYPSRHMDGAGTLGFNPGWVVCYAPGNKLYGTALYVSFLGKMLARGTPISVTTQHQKHQDEVEKFIKKMEQLDASIPMGMERSKVIEILGSPMRTDTNCGPNERWTADNYLFEPQVPVYHLLTNGITIVYSNDAVIRKDPIMGEQR